MRINCHVHIFNLAAVRTPWALGVLRRRLERDVEPELLGKVAGEIAVEIVEDLDKLNEETLLRLFFEKLGGRELVPEIPGPLAGLLLRQVRRLVDRLIDRFREAPEADHREAGLFDVLETLRIAARPSVGDVADWLMRQLGPDDAVVPLVMDLTDGESDRDGTLFNAQLAATSRAILAYPGRLLPFVAVHPLRADHFALMTRALEELGFVGVKLYPSLGYEVDTPAMWEVYRYCHERGIPLLMHTNQSGFVGQPGADQFPDPKLWQRKILPELPELTICFAHFGGGGQLTEPPGPNEPDLPAGSWGKTILELMRDPRFPGTYADVSFHRRPMDSDELARNYFERLGRLLDHPDYRDSILFGTDFWFIRPRLRESSHWRFFEEHLSAERFQRLAERNPARFLGLPGSGARNAALDAHVDFVVRHADRLAAPPADWLLAAIEERHGAGARRQIEERTASLQPARRLLGGRWSALLGAAADRTLADDFDVALEAELDRLETDFLGFPIGFEAGGRLRARVFNRAGDTDPDAVLLPPGAGAGRPEPGHGPLLEFRDDRAWLKYRLEARIGAAARHAAGLAALEIAAGKTVVFADYRAHSRRGELLVDALRRDLRRPRFALSRDDVLLLGDGDALSFQTRGRIAGELRLDWQDVFTSGLGRLAHGLGPAASRLLAVRVEAGAAVSGRLEIVDDFRVVFARQGNWFRLAVRKVEASDKAVGVALRAGVRFANPAAVAAVLDQLVAERLGEPMGAVEALLVKAAPAGPRDRDLLRRLEDRLRVAGLDRVRDEVAALRQKLAETIRDVATARLEAGFTYHYNRLETQATVLEADLREGALEQLHHQLVDGDLTGLLERCSRGDGEIELLHFLRFEEHVRRRAWGFNLGPVGGADVREMAFRSHQDVAGAKKLSYVGLRSYEGRWLGGERWRWSVDLKADMPDFQPEPIAAGAFDYGLGFLLEWDRKLTRTALMECLDAARLWGAAGADVDVKALKQRVDELRLAGKPTAVQLQLLFDHATLGKILPWAVAAGDAELAAALAAAMPYRRARSHESPEARRQAYAGLWEDFLARARRPGFRFRRRDTARKWAVTAAASLRRSGFSAAAGAEERGLASSDRWDPASLAGTLYLNGSPLDHGLAFLSGLGLLRRAWRPRAERAAAGESHEAIATMFERMRSFWQQTHHVRAAGALLLEGARAAGVLEHVGASLTARRTEGEEEWIVALCPPVPRPPH